MIKNFVMTEKQKEYAAAHHNLVYSYLQRNRLDTDTYYDIVIPGYLRAAVKYDERSELHKYSFTTIAWRAMSTELWNYRKYLNRIKRRADVLSLDANLADDKEFSLLDTIAAGDNPTQDLDDKLFWLELFSLLNESQKKLIQLLLMGYPRQQISRKLKIPFHEIDMALMDVWNTVKELFGEYYGEIGDRLDVKGA